MKSVYRIITKSCKKCLPESLREKIIVYMNYPQLRRVVFSKGMLKYYFMKRTLFSEQQKRGISSIPIFIISFNRLSYLKNMIQHLEALGAANIIVIDNASTYPPLLEYYEDLPYEVIRLEKNWGHKVFWENPIFEQYRKDFYVVTDPDLEPVEDCPKDFMEVFFKILKKYPYARKVGFSLKLDDIPHSAVLYQKAIEWEKRFYVHYLPEDNAYIAQIDTTFALYLPDQLVLSDDFYTAFRTGIPYQCRHLPWYKTKEDVTDEDIFYSSLKTTGWWDVTEGQAD